MRDDDRLDDRDGTRSSTGRTDDAASTARLAWAWTPVRRLLAAVPVARVFRATPDRPGRARLAVAAGLLCTLGLVLFAKVHTSTADLVAAVDPIAARSGLVQRAQAEEAASRAQRQAGTAATPGPDASGTTAEATGSAATGATATGPTQPAAPADPPAPPPPVDPGPVAGLTGEQMDNAKAIVRTGHDMGMPRQALIIGVATAMQESNLYNLANGWVPESYDHPHQGSGWDHDSVGLFQQRSSSGWGPVGKLMEPAYATAQFFNRLREIPGWQRMRLSEAAQAVQVSAFPDYYARHEGAATEVVDAIIPPGR